MCLITHCNETSNCCTVSKFNKSVGWVSWSTVIGVKGVNQRAENTTLQCASAESDGGGEVGSQTDNLREVGKKVSNSGADGGGEAQVG